MALKQILALLLVLLIGPPVGATDYWVNLTTGNDSNNGLTPATAKLTPPAMAALMSAGDRGFITNGTYNAEWTVNKRGTSNAWFNFRFDNAIVRKLTIDGCSYTRFVGGEITHNSPSAFNDAIPFGGNSTNVEIIDFFIHDIHTTHNAIFGVFGSQPNLKWITVRGTTITNLGIVNGVYVDDPPGAIASTFEFPFTSTNVIKADHWLNEYNTLQWVGDGSIVFGTNNISRNLSVTRYSKAHWDNHPVLHPDGFQDNSDGIRTMSRHHIYEANWIGDYADPDAHFGIWQDTIGAGDTGMLMRGNIGFNLNGGIGVISTKKVMTYRNTFYGFDTSSPWMIFYNPGGNTDYSTGSYAVNSVSYSSSGIDIGAGNTVTKNHNWGYLAGSDASYRGTTDPLFIDPANTNSRNFRLQSGSPLRGEGLSPILIASATGNGASFTVNDGQLLNDGWGMVDGDTVTVGVTTTRVTGISGNVVTVSPSISWTIGDQVHWGPSSTEDIGALPYSSTLLTGATISNAGTTYTVTPTGDARGVWFYVDGIPTTWDSTPPYQAVIASGNVSAKIYALYAQATPVFTATAGGGPTAPTISSVAAQSIAQDSSTGPLSFTIGDAVDPASSLTVTATSSNHTLADDADCVLGGSGSNRTVNITPNAAQTGVTTIQLVVQNLSLLTATNTFTLTVSSLPVTTNGTTTVRGSNAILKGKRVKVAGGGGGSQVFLINQNFETPVTGYDNGEVWIEGGMWNPAYTVTVLAGSQSCFHADGGSLTSPNFTAQTNVYLYLLGRFNTAVDNTEILSIRSGANADLAIMKYRPGGSLRVDCGNVTAGDTVSTVSTATKYHIWIRYSKGTGANGFASLAFSTNGIKPTSGDAYVQTAVGDATADAVKLRFAGEVGNAFVIDRILISPTPIGDNP